MIKIGINGASGRMGQEIIQIIMNEPDNYVLAFAKSMTNNNNYAVSCVEFPSSPNVDVVIDFSSPESCIETIGWCRQYNIPLVIGTTGFTPEQLQNIRDASATLAVVLSPNMSLSVNVLFAISRLVAKYLPQADVEIVETHHRYKKDAPSGTALKIGEAIAEGRGVLLSDVANYSRPRVATETRPANEIGFAVMRGGDVVGKHTASFFIDGEELNLTSEITNRKSFAAGAIVAAKFLLDKKIGLFTMNDVLGI